jgi:hypothetical protein
MCLLPVCSWGAPSAAPDTDWLARIQQQARLIKTLSADFASVKSVAFLTAPLRTSGRLVYTDAGAVCWEVSKPFRAAAVYNGQQALRYAAAADGRWTPQDAGPDPVLAETMQQLRTWLSGRAFQEAGAYAITVQPGPPLTLRLVPKDPGLKRFIASLDMSFGPRLDVVRTLTLTEASGDWTRITFSNIVINGKMPEDVPGFKQF